MDVDPWAIVVRRGRWYLLCWSHTATASRVLRVDRVLAVDALAQTFAAPPDLDPVDRLEAHLSEGWKYDVDVLIEAPADAAAVWIARSLGRREPVDDTRTRLIGSTDEPDWYVEQLAAAIKAPFRIIGAAELRNAARELAQRLFSAVE